MPDRFDSPTGFDAMTGGVIGTLVGGVAGLALGVAAKKTFPIGGRKDSFDALRAHTHKRLFRARKR